MRTLLTALTCLILFTTPVVAGNEEDRSFWEAIYAFREGDYQKAIALLVPLAEDGYGNAQLQLGEMYSFGEGVPENDDEAVKWYRTAGGEI